MHFHTDKSSLRLCLMGLPLLALLCAAAQGIAQPGGNQQWATEKLAKSSIRKEPVSLDVNGRTLKATVFYPQQKQKAMVVLVLHEVFGLTDSTRNTADEIAQMGYIAISPDMLSGHTLAEVTLPPELDLPPPGAPRPPQGAGGANRGPHADPTALSDEAVNADLNAWADWGLHLPEANGKLAIVGLSWGGGAAFRFAAEAARKELRAAFVFYDIGPPQQTQKFYLKNGPAKPVSVDAIQVPVYGFYPEKDTRVMAGLPATKEAMAAAHKSFEPIVYEGAEHAYMRVGEDPADPNPTNKAAAQASLARLKDLLGKL